MMAKRKAKKPARRARGGSLPAHSSFGAQFNIDGTVTITTPNGQFIFDTGREFGVGSL